ncbi:MAG: flagellar biosynthetic protein FliO [Terracidiphilus sp.]
MTLKVRIKRPLFQSSRPKYGARRFGLAAAGGDRAFIDALADCAGPHQNEALRNQHLHSSQGASADARDSLPAPLIPTPKVISVTSPISVTPPISVSPSASAAKESSILPVSPRPGLLKRTYAWIQERYTLRTTRQLRVSETVSLGEKRFVAILQIEDRKFLIGGSASNVTLLTQLDAAKESINIPAASIPAPEPMPHSRGVY